MKLITAVSTLGLAYSASVDFENMPEFKPLNIEDLNEGSGDYVPYQQTGIFIEQNYNRGGMMDSITSALEAGYNRLYIGFYMNSYGCQAACAEWTTVLGPTKRANTKALLAQYGAELFLSVGGPGEYWEDCIQDENCASNLGQTVGAFANTYLFDGVEMSVNLIGQGTIPSGFATNGTFINTVQELSTSLKSAGSYSTSQIAVSAAAPYFSVDYVDGDASHSLAYLCADANTDQAWAVGTCNLVMFDEDSNYMTYADIFIENNFYDPDYSYFGKGSAVKEIMDQGVDGSKVSVIKPTSSYETLVRSGYVNPIQLGSWGCQAQIEIGWTGGFVAWSWNSVEPEDLSKTNDFALDTTCV